MSVSSSDSQLSCHTEAESESEASDYDIEAKAFIAQDEGVQAVRFRKKERCFV